MSAFAVGQRVVAKSEAQGLRLGAVYDVVQVDVRTTFAGGFTEYQLRPVDGDGQTIWVGNGHLLLTGVEAEEIQVHTPRFFCKKVRCTNPAHPDVEVVCPSCGRAYERCENHGGEAAARRSLKSHRGLYHAAVGADR